jgi:hypothetical protein
MAFEGSGRARFICLANLAWLGLAWQVMAPQSFTRLSPSDKLRTAGVRSFSPSTEGRHWQPATYYKPIGSLKHAFKSTLDALEIGHISLDNTR